MQSALDQAITKASTAEATYAADVANVTNIQQAIDAATTPLVPAQQQASADAAAYNASLDDLIAAAQAAKVSTP